MTPPSCHHATSLGNTKTTRTLQQGSLLYTFIFQEVQPERFCSPPIPPRAMAQWQPPDITAASTHCLSDHQRYSFSVMSETLKTVRDDLRFQHALCPHPRGPHGSPPGLANGSFQSMESQFRVSGWPWLMRGEGPLSPRPPTAAGR